MTRHARSTTRAELTTGVVCSVGVGPERGGRPMNQDNYLVCAGGRMVWRDGDVEAVTFVQPRNTTVLAVADGMGGHEDGEVASASAVQAMARLYVLDPPADPEAALRTFMMEAHRRIRDRVLEFGDVKMGTTLTVAWILGATVWWGHIGDSRLYHWRNGRITRITRDHTREEFALRDGRPLPSHPRYLAQNFIYGSRGLGHDSLVRMDRGIDTGSFTLQPGDRVIVSSDGLHSYVDDIGIADCVKNVPEPAACAVALHDRALARESDDNVTALIARCDEVVDVPSDEDDDHTIVPV